MTMEASTKTPPNAIEDRTTLEILKQLKADYPDRAARAIALLRTWMADESGYDEAAWPELKVALDRNRTSERKLFDV
jgi:hypothetical protein